MFLSSKLVMFLKTAPTTNSYYKLVNITNCCVKREIAKYKLVGLVDEYQNIVLSGPYESF